MKSWATVRANTRLDVESVPAAVTTGGRETHMLEILTVIEQSLQCWKTHQRHPRHFIANTRVLDDERATGE